MYNDSPVKLVDCPRDAIQGIKSIIPTEKKIMYMNSLLESELFDYIDFGSFVSPHAIPQLADTAMVLDGLQKNNKTKLIAIIANEKGAQIGKYYDKLDYLGYPFSVSDTFQKRNTNRSILDAYKTIAACKDILQNTESPELMIYLSMAFGNPYGDPWHPEEVVAWMDKLVALGIAKFSIADTTSLASPAAIKNLFSVLHGSFPKVELSIHLHSNVASATDKIQAAYEAGCRIFEGAVMGYGGCPFAQDELVGNIPSELLLNMFTSNSGQAVESLIENFQLLLQNAV
ncbi:hydroxymethylglutaryl-CoA lyase [Sphingobacterium sp. LRF_L2]|uniref:hydroxymethylglutaryl-CoA lyase n=1 Tax=Sphingobacterium sp. LRF_L2 TaxID=3369421 RepID=UPI003F5DDEA3